MNMSVTDYKKCTALLLGILMLFSAMAVLFSADLTSAEEEEEDTVEEYDGDLDADFVYKGVVYKITSDEETEEEVAVVALADITASEQEITVVTAFSYGEDDDEVTYTVTGILENAFKDVSTMKSLLLPTTLTSIGKDAFTNCVITNGLVIPALYDDESNKVTVPASEEEMDAEEYFADYETYKAFFIDDSTAVDLMFYINVYSAAELHSTNIEDFEDGIYTQTVYADVLNKLADCEFERDYFSCAGWSFVKGDPVSEDDVALGDGDGITIDDLDGHTDLYAAWEEDSPYEDYPEWMMWTTVGIIIVLAVIGLAMMAYRARQASA